MNNVRRFLWIWAGLFFRGIWVPLLVWLVFMFIIRYVFGVPWDANVKIGLD